MINVWDFVNSKKVKVTDIEEDTFIGNVVCVMDSEENGTDEDDITIQIDKDTIIGFPQSEIKKMKQKEIVPIPQKILLTVEEAAE